MKIYISKSYQAPQGIFEELLRKLTQEGHYVTYHNPMHTYSPNKQLKADLVLFIPPELGVNNYSHLVGKGQYGEATLSLRNNIPSYIITKLGMGGTLYFREIKQVKPHNTDNWKDKFGWVFSEGNLNSLFGMLNFNNPFPVKELKKRLTSLKKRRFFYLR